MTTTQIPSNTISLLIIQYSPFLPHSPSLYNVPQESHPHHIPVSFVLRTWHISPDTFEDTNSSMFQLHALSFLSSPSCFLLAHYPDTTASLVFKEVLSLFIASSHALITKSYPPSQSSCVIATEVSPYHPVSSSLFQKHLSLLYFSHAQSSLKSVQSFT